MWPPKNVTASELCLLFINYPTLKSFKLCCREQGELPTEIGQLIALQIL
jgi:hypothetical protein